MDNAFIAMQTILSIAPIPGVAACAVALQEVRHKPDISSESSEISHIFIADL